MESKINYSYFDIYSKRASFFYNNQEKIGSFFSCFLTIVYVLTSLSLFFYYLAKVFKRTEMKVYDTTIYNQEMPSLNIDSNDLYFAFGLEKSIHSKRYIDDTIYYPKILFINQIKEDGGFKTIEERELAYERCKEENFGINYQSHFIKGELNNSYCLKDFNYSLNFVGGYKYEQMSFIQIKIFPCKNTSENNNHCKPQEVIDYYLSPGYFSIMLKNFGLNPSNYFSPIFPTIKDLSTTIDNQFYRSYVINLGVTEVHTDISIFNEVLKKEKFLQYREVFQSFYFMDEKDYLDGKEICIVQLKLDDAIIIQKRTYMKLSEILSKVGGSMQLLYTIFSLLSLFINKFNFQLKIINSIFSFNIKENKMCLKLKSLDFDSITMLSSNKNLMFSSKKTLHLNNLGFNNNNNDNTTKNKNRYKFCILNRKESRISSKLEVSDNKKIMNNSLINSKISLTKDNIIKINNKKSLKSNDLPKINYSEFNKVSVKTITDFKEDINLNLCDYVCHSKKDEKDKQFQLYKLGNSFYRKRMDIVHVFTLLLITEKVLLKSYGKQIYSLCKDNDFLYNKKH